MVAGRGLPAALAGALVSGPDFRESHWRSAPIRDLGLVIAGTQLEPLVAQLMAEAWRAGIRRLKPRFYLSTEWGVPSDTSAIAIPFYLAAPELTALHSERTGFVEGQGRADILRYLRHELGHAVNYAYRLFDDPEWVRHFGAFTQPYLEEYRPQPFSRRYVRHLPGWYAQKHPDEDWSETFAVWLTPGIDWRAEYAAWPEALAKLEYCDRVMKEIGERDPLVGAEPLDTDVSEVAESLEQFYEGLTTGEADLPPGLDGALRAVFEDGDGALPASEGGARLPAGGLLRELELELMADVYRWTGHFPEETRLLVRHLAERADHLRQTYAAERERRVAVEVTTLVTALAMNHVHFGSYLP
jgi:hypothetical protein